MTDISKEQLEQRVAAARTHGAYAIRDRGEDAMTPVQRLRRTELVEQFQTRQGVIEAMRDQAVDALVLVNVAQSFCVQQTKEGKPLDKIPLLTQLPRFHNAANRALKQYFDVLPDESELLEIDAILDSYNDNESED